MASVYLISRGSYSDYGIVAAYSTKEKAEAALPLYTGSYDQPQIEEYDLDPVDCQIPVGCCFWSLRMELNGDCSTPAKTDPTKETNVFVKAWKKYECMITVVAKNHSHARKIANEIRVQLIANNAWPNMG